MKVSRYEANIYAQPRLIDAALAAAPPAWMKPPRKDRKVWFVGVGTNHHAARLAAWLWNKAGFNADAEHAYDFVSRPHRFKNADLGVFLSHRGGNSYTVRAEALARRRGAQTVVVTASASPWKSPRRIETGPLEDTGAFTHSLTCTMAWLLRWTGNPALVAPFSRLRANLSWGPAFPRVRRESDVVFIGDGLREWVARETALKIQETAYLRARAFGLEEFLHGPQISVGPGSLVIGFASPLEKRWGAARAYLRAIGTPFVSVSSQDWLAQIAWGQRFALASCRGLRIDPDLLRADDPRYRRARALLALAPAGR